jgi:hypothetical protein
LTSSAPSAANDRLVFDDAFHKRLAQWNHRRLSPATPNEDWRNELAEEHAMRELEGEFMESFRQEVADRAAAAPTDPEGMLRWFEDLKQTGPGQNDPCSPGSPKRPTWSPCAGSCSRK